MGILNDTGFPKDLKTHGDALFIIRRIPGILKECSVTFLLNSSVFGPGEDLSRASIVQWSQIYNMANMSGIKSRARQLSSLTKQQLHHKLQLQSDFTVTCHTGDLWEMWTAFDVWRRWQCSTLQWLRGLNWIFSQAAGVTDLSANDSQCWAAMEKTHVRPTGGKVEVPGLHRGRQAWPGIYVRIKSVLCPEGLWIGWSETRTRKIKLFM